MVETIGEAWQLGWRVTARCAWGKRDGLKTIRECRYSKELDMHTLVWTRALPFRCLILHQGSSARSAAHAALRFFTGSQRAYDGERAAGLTPPKQEHIKGIQRSNGGVKTTAGGNNGPS
jgi:hypothetical protein